MIVSLTDTDATLGDIGGKALSLVRLAVGGIPVPDGFVVTTAAYHQFVTAHDLGARIATAVRDVRPDDPASLERAAATIGALFEQHDVPSSIADAIRDAYGHLDDGDAAVAVRSSATAEDLPELSFAGQQESFLNVRGGDAVVAAVLRCWASLWGARAIGYRAQHDIVSDELGLAVVVQRLVAATSAGVLFTAHPVTHRRDQMVIDATWGLGDALVGGATTPDTVVLRHADGAIIEQRIGSKERMTVLTANGTAEADVPAAQRAQPVLAPSQIRTLHRLGMEIEHLYGVPMDIEWVFDHDRCAIVQARPITSAARFEAWNDSLRGTFLWTRTNVGEAVPGVMTPLGWSFVQHFIAGSMPFTSFLGVPLIGNIGGRFYLNLSLTASLGAAFGISVRRLAALTAEVFGSLPEGLDVPLLRLGRWRILRAMAPISVRLLRRVQRNLRRFPAYLAAAPQRCEALRLRAEHATTTDELRRLWEGELSVYLEESSQMLEAASRQGGNVLIRMRGSLAKRVGLADANALLTGLQSDTHDLASLGLVLDLTRLGRGEIDRATFARRYGHRAPDELDVSAPRPAEDSAWIDEQLAGLRAAPLDAEQLVARQHEARRAAIARLHERFGSKADRMLRRIERGLKAARDREGARSELVRTFWALRAWALRAGALTGIGEDVFFLSLDDVLLLLGGDRTVLRHVAPRRAAYERYRALPAYPVLIRGHFDPFRWATDANRRSDVWVEGQNTVPASATITGAPGAQGVVEGTVRVLHSAAEGAALQAGEIIVTTVTNIGWTPLFPRAAAVVTDVGAPLSHAAIVAREMGIPAVVGCGNATMLLHTGDRVRVDGGRGVVEVLEPAPSSAA